MNFNHLIENQTRVPESIGTFEEIEIVPFASKGIWYPGNKPGIKMRKIDWRDEDILTTKSFYDNGKVIEEIINNCIREPGWTYDMLLPVDKDGLLIWLRMSAWDQWYDVNFNCPLCQQPNTLTWNLGEIEFPEVSPEIEDEILTNQYITHIITVNKRNVVIKLVIPTIGKEKLVEDYLNVYARKNGKLLNNREFNSTGKLISSILSITDIDPQTNEPKEIQGINEIHEWLLSSGLSLKQSRAIQVLINKIGLSIKAEKHFHCTKNLKSDDGEDILIDGKPLKCSYQVPEPVVLPITINFFWPESDDQQVQESDV